MEEKSTSWIYSPENLSTHQSPRVYRSESLEDLSESEFDAANKNTKRKTETDMRILSSYLVSLNENRQVEMIPPLELDRYLSKFFSVIKKHDGYEYEPASLRGMLCSIERYLRMRSYPNSVTRDIAFINTRNMLKERQIILRERASVVKKCKQESLTSSALEKLKQLYVAKEFGPYSPMAVINSLCFVFLVHLKIRKAIDHKQLLWGDIALKTENGREYLCYEPLPGFEFLRPKLVTNAVHRVYSHILKDSTWDPLEIYKLYRSKRPPQMMTPDSPFYLGVALPAAGQMTPHQWYRTSPIGVNKINDLVRMIRDITGSISHGFGELLTMHQSFGFNSTTNVPAYDNKVDVKRECDKVPVDKGADNKTGVKFDSHFSASTSNTSHHTDDSKGDDSAGKLDERECAVTGTQTPYDEDEQRINDTFSNGNVTFERDRDEVLDFKRTVLTLLSKMDETSKQSTIQWMQSVIPNKERPPSEGSKLPSSKIHLSVTIDPSTLSLDRATAVTARITMGSEQNDSNEEASRSLTLSPPSPTHKSPTQASDEHTDRIDINNEIAVEEDEDDNDDEDDGCDDIQSQKSSRDGDSQSSVPDGCVSSFKRTEVVIDDETIRSPKRVKTETDSKQLYPQLPEVNPECLVKPEVSQTQVIVPGVVSMAHRIPNPTLARDTTVNDLCSVYPPWALDPRLAFLFQNRLAAQSQQELLQNMYASAHQSLQKD